LETAKLNSKTIVVITAGGGINTTGWLNDVKGLLHSFYLGESAGPALADILFGKINPSGKLPFTMSEHWEDFGSTAHYVSDPGKTNAGRIHIGQGTPSIRRVHPMEYQEGLFIGYRHFERESITPLFPFGFGLSYTTFSFDHLRTKIVKKESHMAEVSLVVKNTGSSPGAEVAQLYIGDEESTLIRPPKELKRFRKVFLEPGESKEILFKLDERAFQYYDPYRGNWRLEPGNFFIMVGNCSQNIMLTDKITL
jgi:beta-glucosidase